MIWNRFQPLEERIMFTAEPTVTIDAPDEVLVGEDVDITLTFDNTHPSDTGFGPYIDLILPVTGEDGAGVEADDGIDFVSASYLGQPLVTTEITFDGSGDATHPYAVDSSDNPIVYSGTPGDKLVVLQLPFGSYTPDQTPVDVSVSLSLSSLADVGSPLTLEARGGFQFGGDALDNPASDPSIAQPTFAVPSDTHQITPSLVTLQKDYLGPSDTSDETATGPNFQQTYRLTVDIADGQTLTDIDLIDFLPEEVAFVGVSNITPGSGVASDTPTVGAPQLSPDNRVLVEFGSVTGTASAADLSIEIDFFVAELDASGNPVLDPANGDERTSINDAQLEALWTPIDSRDGTDPISVTSDETSQDHILIDRSIAIQKSVTHAAGGDVNVSGFDPGDTIEYTLSIQVSDFFTYGDLVIDDVISDGQRFDNSTPPTFSVTEAGSTTNGSFANGTDFSFTLDSPGTGTTAIQFELSEAFQGAGGDGILSGGLTSGSNVGATTATITYRTIIQDQFSDTFPSGEPEVNQGDVLNNTAVITASQRDNANNSTVLDTETDNAAASVTIVTGQISSKEIYAVNGVTPSGPVEIAAGDEVTYRITATLPLSSVEDYTITDFLPLPVFNLSDYLAGDFTTFTDTVDGTSPAAGEAKFGPDDTFRSLSGIVPTITKDLNSNALIFEWGDFSADPRQTTTVDILFTVEALDEEFGDELQLTNLATVEEGNTGAESVSSSQLVQLTYTEPVVTTITKGLVATTGAGSFTSTVGPTTVTAPGTAGFRFGSTVNSDGVAGTPVDADLIDVDAGDLVTVAIVVENLGEGVNGVFDLDVEDIIPTGFAVPSGGSGLNLSVTDGAGSALAFTGDLFAGGIEITDGASDGALTAFDETSGTNILVITYDLEAQTSVEPEDVLQSDATLTNYAAQEGGLDRTSTDLTDPASVTIVEPDLAKAVVATSNADTGTGQGSGSLDDLTIGEQVTFHVTATLGEGTTDSAVIVDDLPASAAGLLSVVSSRVVSIGGNIAGSALSVNDAGTASDQQLSDGLDDRVTFDFGTLTNTADGVSDADDQIVVEIVAVVEDDAANAGGDQLTNQASLSYAAGSVSATADVDIVEPVLEITKTPSSATADAGNTVTYTVELSHDAASTAPAYDVVLTDLLTDPNLSLVAGTVAVSNPGIATITTGNGGGDTTVRVDVASFQLAASPLTVTFDAQLASTAPGGGTVDNTADVVFDSIAGADANQRSGSDSADASVDVGDPEITKTIFDTSIADTGTAEHDPALTDLAIGEEVTYRMSVTLSEGVTDITIIDDLPASATGVLSLVSSRVVSIGGNISGSSLNVNDAGTASDEQLSDGQDDRVTFDFGTLTNSGDNVVNDDDRIVVEVVARVADLPANADGDQLTNTATLDFGAGTTSDTVDVEIVEPDLDVTITPSVTDGDAGDTVTFTVELEHLADSTAPAYDLVLTDLLADANLSLVAGTISIASNPGGAVVTTGNTGGDSTVRIDLADFDPGDSDLVFTFDAVIQDGAELGGSVGTTIDLAFDSAPGAGADHRTGADSAATSVAIDTPVLAKAVTASSVVDGTTTELTIGETVTYQLTATLAEGSGDITIIDDLPASAAGVLSLVSSRVVSIGANIAGSSLNVNDAGTTSDLQLSDGLDDRIIFDFGTVTNSGDNVVDADDRIVVEIVAQVIDDPSNEGGDVLTNGGTLDYGTGTDLAAADVSLVEPVLDLTASVSPASGDAGDVVTYTLTLDHGGGSSGTAYDVVLSDLLTDPGLNLVAGTVAVSNGSIATITTGNGGSDSTVRVDLVDFEIADGPLTVTFDATLDDSVRIGDTLTNSASVAYDSLPGNDPEQRQGSDPGTDDVTVTGTPTFAKAIVSTSQAATGSAEFDGALTDLAIGETVTFELTATLAEGTTELSLIDSLPASAAGVLSVVSSEVVSIGANISGSSLNVSDPGVAADASLSDGLDDQVTFDFGTVTNSGDNGSTADDQIVVRVVALVENLPANEAGDQLTSPASMTYSTTSGNVTLDDSVDVEIVEPLLTLDKSVSLGGAEPGDTVTYTITLDHDATSSAEAYDLVLTDLLSDPDLSLVDGSVVVSDGGLATITTGNGVGDSTVRIDLSTYSRSDAPLTITFDVDVAPDATLADTLSDQSDLTFDNLPGSDANQRTDSVSANADLHLVPELDKAVTATSVPDTGSAEFDAAELDLAIGETITYQMTITLPETLTDDVILTEDLAALPGFLGVVSSRVVSIGGNITGSALNVGDPGAASDAQASDGIDDRVVFDFGDLTNSADSVIDGDDRIVVEVVARVEDVAANVAGTDLASDTALTAVVGGRSTIQSASETAEIVTPELVIDKGVNTTNADAGDIITYTVTLDHAATSTAAAFDVVISDLLADANLELQTGSVSVSNPGIASITEGNGGGDTDVRIDLTTFATSDPTLTITYDVKIRDSAPAGGQVSNSADLAYDTLPGADPNARALSATDTQLVDVNQSFDVAAEVISTSVSETDANALDPGIVDLAIGETVTYQLTLTLEEGTAPLTLTDVLPASADGVLSLVSSRVVSIGGNISGSTLNVGDPATASDDLLADGLDDTATFSFGTLVNAGDNVIDDDDRIVVEVVARIEDLPANAAGDRLTSTATLDFGLGTREETIDVEIVEPSLSFTKTASETAQVITQPVTYTITIAHDPTSNGPAYDVVLEDLIDEHLDLVDGSVTVSDPDIATIVSGNEAGDDLVSVDIPVLEADAPALTVTFQAILLSSAPPLDPVADPTSLTFDSYPGIDAAASDYAGRAASIEAASELGVIIPSSRTDTGPVREVESLAAATTIGSSNGFGDSFRSFRSVLALDPFYSGSAEPGSTLSITLRNSQGEIVGSQSVLVDAGGNWAASFPLISAGGLEGAGGRDDYLAETRLFGTGDDVFSSGRTLLGFGHDDRSVSVGTGLSGLPYAIQTDQTRPSYASDTGNGFDTRTYFVPAVVHETFGADGPLQLGDILDNRAESKIAEQFAAARHPMGLGWNRFMHEFFAA